MNENLMIPESSLRGRIRRAIEGVTSRAETLRLAALNLDDVVGELSSHATGDELRQAVVAVENCALRAILDAATILRHAAAMDAYSEIRDLDER